MIFTALFYLIGVVLVAFNSVLPTWTPWPDVVRDFFIKCGHYSNWASPWYDMQSFWGAIEFTLAFMLGFFSIKILSRIFRIKIFKD